MWPDGICRVTDTRYTKTIQYQDINYQLSQNEDKTAMLNTTICKVPLMNCMPEVRQEKFSRT